MNPYEIIQNLVDEYHSNPDAFSPEQGERLATQAFESGIPFRPETKKLAKFGFDTADTALFGMLPNQWRPERDGEELYGESEGEKLAGGAGSILGLIPAGFGAGALIKGGLKAGKGMIGKVASKFGKKGGGSGGGAMTQNANQHVAQLPQGTSLLQLSQGARRLNPAQRALNPTSILNNTDDYLDTAINQAFIR